MEKTATLNLRVNPNVKQRAEEVLTRLGIPMSTAIDMYLNQISLTGGIPFPITLPNSSTVLNADLMTSEEIRTKLREGYDDAQAGRVQDAASAFVKRMDFKMLTSSDKMWNEVRDYAQNCSWGAGKSLANAMENNLFTEWERVIIALDNQKICGYCTVAKTDCIPDVCYTPYIGYLFVGEAYRGKRLSQRLIQYAADYLESLGFDRVHIVSDHENLYEKYGFEIIDRKAAPWGSMEKIYMRKIDKNDSEYGG